MRREDGEGGEIGVVGEDDCEGRGERRKKRGDGKGEVCGAKMEGGKPAFGDERDGGGGGRR